MDKIIVSNVLVVEDMTTPIINFENDNKFVL